MQVSAVRTGSYDPQEVKAAVKRHFAALDVASLLFPGARVVLKPNLLMKRSPSEATTTSPLLVEAVARELRELGVSDIIIADSPGGPYTAGALEGIYKAAGMTAAAERSGAALNRSTGYADVPCGVQGGLCSSFNLIDPVREADVLINLPKLKTHAMATLSGSVKNLFGCIPGLQKPEYHFRFPQKEQFGRMLVELAETVRPALTIVDGVEAMEGDGPSAGSVRQLGWTFASRDCYSLDLALCGIMGLEPAEVATVDYAMKHGLGAASPEKIVFLEDGRPQGIHPFVQPKSRETDFSQAFPGPVGELVSILGSRLLVPRPVVRRNRCIGCGKCAESCPAHTIDLSGKKARILNRNCIKCYCCHEMCPVSAIDIRRFKLLEH